MVSRKDYRKIALIWVDILENFDDFVQAEIIHRFFKERLSKEYSNFDMDKYDTFMYDKLN
tara:strand:- start:1097 stop:1276 length:180 start_codon:yes stop_codon:yes gene_type:complete